MGDKLIIDIIDQFGVPFSLIIAVIAWMIHSSYVDKQNSNRMDEIRESFTTLQSTVQTKAVCDANHRSLEREVENLRDVADSAHRRIDGLSR